MFLQEWCCVQKHMKYQSTPPDSEKEEKLLWKSHLTEFADGTQWSETVTMSACGGMLCVCLHAWAWVETRLNEAPLWDRHPSEVAAVCVSFKKKVSGGKRKLAWGQHPPHAHTLMDQWRTVMERRLSMSLTFTLWTSGEKLWYGA